MSAGHPFSEQEASHDGFKARLFAPQPNVTINDLVPADHFYRHLDRTLDLSLVRELVRDCSAPLGRPSIEPILFFKLPLVTFFEGIRSARQLEVVGADRLSVRWYLGYDLQQSLPDHSPKTQKLHRVLWHTYIEPAPTQEAVAELLGLPFSTYRHQLGRAVDQLVAWLWQQELYGVTRELS